ncbi:uncharacterized protein LOC124536534 [Vanessa cardui]|uniref:uncharacterized protein LOC124536534 n=1 Tax=Vanessa cardui TaxID=171605 RepID=UPI001F133B16|nr:uncharacterized protein LOC124536534 [Vanessa cardui]
MLFHCVLIIYSCTIIVYAKEFFDVQVDELMDSMLENVYMGKFRKSNLIYKSTTEISKYHTTKKSLVTTTRALTATRYSGLKKYAENMTMEEFIMRKRQIDIDNLLDLNFSPIPNFDKTNDEIAMQTRRFNSVRKEAKKQNNLRQVYFDYENGTFIYGEKNRTVTVMAQFVYETHYRLPYAQILRQKYIHDVKYRMGYCFALLRTLKQQQMVIYSTMRKYSKKMWVVFTHLKWYEKVLKLNVDIKDLIKYILHLNKIRENELTTTTEKLEKTQPQ